MKINKETLRKAFEAGIVFAHGEQDFIKFHNPTYKKPDFDAWYASLSKKEEVDVIEEGWVDYKVEKPTIDNYYLIRNETGTVMVSDWWDNDHFLFNDDFITQWKRN